MVKEKLQDLYDNQMMARPLTIGRKVIDSRLVMASMSQVGNVAFRELVSYFGGFGLLFGEMWSARSVIQEKRGCSPYFMWSDLEKPRLVVQLLGNEPDTMAKAARKLEKEGFFGIDINVSCSIKKVCKKNMGASLLNSPDKAAAIVDSVRQAVSMPVFVKFRLNRPGNVKGAVMLARTFESAGADALTFHPRAYPDIRTRPPRWEYIKDVAGSVNIPVFGNGNVFSQKDCTSLITQTGCAGLALGRITLARPWIFASFSGKLEEDLQLFYDSAKRLLELHRKYFDGITAIKRYKKYSFYFCANFLFGHQLHRQILKAENVSGIDSALDRFFDDRPLLAEKPNLNFL